MSNRRGMAATIRAARADRLANTSIKRALSRAEMDDAIKRDGGVEVTIDNKSELFHVKGHIWRKARMEPFGGCLCVGCIEERLGRKLRQRDFVRDHPFNNTGRGTMRLLDRLGYTAR